MTKFTAGTAGLVMTNDRAGVVVRVQYLVHRSVIILVWKSHQQQ